MFFMYKGSCYLCIMVLCVRLFVSLGKLLSSLTPSIAVLRSA